MNTNNKETTAMMKTAIVVAAALALAACVNTPSEPKPGPKMSAAAPTTGPQVCAHLTQIGCSAVMISPETCEAQFDRLKGQDLKNECLYSAQTPYAAQMCGTVTCIDTVGAPSGIHATIQ